MLKTTFKIEALNKKKLPVGNQGYEFNVILNHVKMCRSGLVGLNITLR